MRGGNILPIAPLIQSTSEMPVGPLTLRVYPLAPGLNTPGEYCAGEVYGDDGHSFKFRDGDFARIRFTRTVAPDGSVTVNAGRQQGSWEPWWHEYRIEVIGFTPKVAQATVGKRQLTLSKVDGYWGVVNPATAVESLIELK